MRIDLNSGAGGASDAAEVGKPSSAAVANAAANRLPADQAEMSSDRVDVQALSAAVLQLPEIRQEKVAALAGQVQAGSYQVAPQHTAEALLTALTTSRAA